MCHPIPARMIGMLAPFLGDTQGLKPLNCFGQSDVRAKARTLQLKPVPFNSSRLPSTKARTLQIKPVPFNSARFFRPIEAGAFQKLSRDSLLQCDGESVTAGREFVSLLAVLGCGLRLFACGECCAVEFVFGRFICA